MGCGKCFKKTFLFGRSIELTILARACSFWIALLQRLVIWPSKDKDELNFISSRVLGQLPPRKLTLTQTLILTGGNLPRGQLPGCPLTLKLTLTLTQTPALTGGNFPREAIDRMPSSSFCSFLFFTLHPL